MNYHSPVYRVVLVKEDGDEVLMNRPYTTLGAARNRRSYLQNGADYRTKYYNAPKRTYKVQVTDGAWLDVE